MAITSSSRGRPAPLWRDRRRARGPARRRALRPMWPHGLDQPREHLVREQPAAPSQAQAVAGRLEQAGFEAPGERGSATARRRCRRRGAGRGSAARTRRSRRRRPPSRRAAGGPRRAPRATGRTRASFQRRSGRRTRARPGRRASNGSALPVREVVPGLVPGPRPVRDLVVAVARGGQAILGKGVLLGRAVLVLPGASTLAPSPRAARHGQVIAALGVVERQRVQRQVVRLECEGGVERRGPRSDGLAGRVVQQVDVHRRDPGRSRLPDGGRDVVRASAAVPAPAARRGPGSAPRTRSA